MTALGVTAVARSLGISRSAVRKAIDRGTLATNGYPFMVEPAEVERYREQNLLNRGDRADERRAYRVLRSLADAGTTNDAIRATLRPATLDAARSYAIRRRAKWPAGLE